MKSLNEGPCPASLFFRHIGEPLLKRYAAWFVGKAAGIELVEFFEEIEGRLITHFETIFGYPVAGPSGVQQP